jgi:enamine deaminase RidA (YjgF/YER057c/UK114 family)
MKRTHLDPPDLADWSSLFSQVVVTEGSRLRIVAVSGQVGVDAQQRICGDGSLEAQLDGAFRNLAVALSAASCSPTDVVKITIYVVGYTPEKAGPIQEAVRRHLGDPPLPACSLIGVAALARPEFQVEVEALAITEGSGS